MPSRAPPRVCSKPGCFSIARTGSRCPLHPYPQKRPRERSEADRLYDDARGSAHARGYDKRLWRRARDRKLMEQPTCEACERVGRTTEATEVDHIIPLAHGGTHDPENLQSLCHPCHVRKTYEDRRRYGGAEPSD